MTSLVTVERLDHVHLCVEDRTAAVAFYARTLGLTLIGDPPDQTAADHPVFLGIPGAHTPALSLFIGPAATGADRNVAFHVGAEAFLAFLDRLPDDDVIAQAGGPLTRAHVNDYGMAMTLDFLDPSGNELELVTYEAAAVRKALA